MRSDANLAFVPIGGNLSVVGSADVPSNIIDLLGIGVGQAPTPDIIGNVSTFGTDMGIGGVRPELNVVTGLADFVGTSLQAKFQAAADQGAAGNYQPSTWVTLGETPAILSANLLAGTVFARFPWLPAFPANLRPRYLRLLFTPVAITTGVIASAIVTLVRDDQANKYAANNYRVA